MISAHLLFDLALLQAVLALAGWVFFVRRKAKRVINANAQSLDWLRRDVRRLEDSEAERVKREGLGAQGQRPAA